MSTKKGQEALQTIYSSIPKLEQYLISLNEKEQILEKYLEVSLDEKHRIKVENSIAEVKSAIEEVKATLRAIEIVIGEPLAKLYMKRWMKPKGDYKPESGGKP